MSLCVCYSLCVCVLLFTRKKLCAGCGESTGKELFKMCVCFLLCVCVFYYLQEGKICAGRWESTGKEMFKLQDRHGMEFCLGPVSISWFNFLLLLIFKWTFKWTSEMCTYKNEVVCVSVRDWAIFVRMKMRVGWVCVCVCERYIYGRSVI